FLSIQYDSLFRMPSAVSSPICCCTMAKKGQKEKKELKKVHFLSQHQLTASPPAITQLKVDDLNSSRSLPPVYELAPSTKVSSRDGNYNDRNFPSMGDLIREIRMEEGLPVTDRPMESHPSLPSTSCSSTCSSSSSKGISPPKTEIAVIPMPDATVTPTVVSRPPSTFYRIVSAVPQNLFLLIAFTYTCCASVIIQFTRIFW
ncbi:hypothetical protein PMAYCL1PPCAC_32776, partial [Pristionchus mayeri]